MHLFHQWQLMDFLTAIIYSEVDDYKETAVRGFVCTECGKRKIEYCNLPTKVHPKNDPDAQIWAIDFMNKQSVEDK